MIARDEERFLEQCLKSVEGVADEIILVDTGSSDRTVGIAERYGAKVSHFPWGDDFAAARNQAVERATGEWMLVLDPDERLAEGGPAIREAIAQPDWETGYLRFANVEDNGSPGHEWTAPRLYRLRPGVRFVGRIHEQVVHPSYPIRSRLIDARVYHYGYQASVYAERNKKERNARLLEQALRDPEAQDPLLRTNYLFHWANLAKDRELLERYQDLAAYIARTWPQGAPRAPWITGALAEYARLLNDVGRHQESLELAERLLERHGESPMLHYLAARARAAEGDLPGAEAEVGRALASPPEVSEEHRQYTQDIRLAQGRARFLLALIQEKTGRGEEAIQHYRAAVDEEPDQEMMRSHYACALTRLGRYPEALGVLETSATMVNNPQPGADCLGLVLAVLAQSVSRLVIWGEKVQRLAPDYPPAARLLERLASFDPRRQFQLQDFPEVAAAIELEAEPGRVRMPQTGRKSTAFRQ